MTHQWLKAFDAGNVYKYYRQFDLTSNSQFRSEDVIVQEYINQYNNKSIWKIFKSKKSISDLPHPWLNRSYTGEYSAPDISIKSYI